MLKSNIILFFYIVCNNAFLLTQVTQVNKIYFTKRKHINRKLNIVMNNKVNNTANYTINNNMDDFPSFYEFLRTNSISNTEKIENVEDVEDIEDLEDIEDVETIKAEFLNFKENINEDIKTNSPGKDFANNLNSKHLKLLRAFSAIQWARTWIYEMVHISEFFPTFMYQDMYNMCDFGSVNVSKRYFYIGYYPPTIDQKKGPYYIGAFEINPPEREFITRIIIQNPYHCVKNNYNKEHIINFKKELQILCNEATVFLKYSNLKNTSLERYYYSWNYEE